MNVGSTFSGIGGMDAGLARAGLTHVFLCEIDEWRRLVLAERFPEVPIYDDVRNVGTDAIGLDLLCGGFPCQDLSVAGQRRGLMHEGGRSNLFFEFARIADELVQPGGWVLIENVPGLLSSNDGRDFAIVLATLAELGFHDLAWRVLDSRHFGVPQRRRRVFILGRRAGGRRAFEVLLEPEGSDGDPQASDEAGPGVAYASLSGIGSGGPDDNDAQAGRIVSALTTRAGNTQGDQQSQQLVVAATLQAHRGKDGGGISPEETLIAIGVSISENQRGELLETDYAHQLTGGGGKPGQGYPAARTAQGVRRLTPVECCRLQGLPDDWFAGVKPCPDSRMYAGLGDAVTANVAEWIGKRMLINASRNGAPE